MERLLLLQSEPGSPFDCNVQGDSPDKDFARDDSADQELSEEGSYRETIRGVKSFMGWHQIPDFDSALSSFDDNPFAGSRAQPTGKVSIKLPVDDWLCRKLEKLNLTISEGYPSRNAETSLERCPDLLDGMICILSRRTLVDLLCAPGHLNWQSSTVPSAGLPDTACLLPWPPRQPPRTL